MKRRIIAITLVCMILITFSGCNVTEVGLYDTIKAMLNLQDIKYSGDISVNFDNIEITPTDPPEYLYNSGLEAKTFANKGAKVLDDGGIDIPDGSVEEILTGLKLFFDENSIVYDGVVSVVDNKASFNLGLKNSSDEVIEIISIIAIDKKIYISEDIMIMLLGPDNFDIEILDGVEYAVFTFEEIADVIADFLKDDIIYGHYSSPDITWDYGMTSSYYYSYTEGYYEGNMDGFEGVSQDFTVPGYVTDYLSWMGVTLDNDAYVAGYTSGYNAGVSEKADALVAMAEIDEMKDLFLQEASVANLIKALQGVVTKSGDEFIYNFFDDFELGLVQKDGNKFSLNFDNENYFDVLEDLIVYVIENNPKMVSSLKTIVNSLTDEELILMLINPSDRQDILDDIDDLEAPDDADIDEAVSLIREIMGEIETSVSETIQFESNSSLEKTGFKSYDIQNISSLSYISDEPVMIGYTEPNSLIQSGSEVYDGPDYEYAIINFDVEIVENLYINEDSQGDPGVDADFVEGDETTAKLEIDVEDENAVETGVIISTSPEMTNPITVVGEEEDGKIFANATGLTEDTKYYYLAYSIDGAGNKLYGETVKDFTTLKSTATPAPTATPVTIPQDETPLANPETGDDFNYVAMFSIMGLSLVGITVLLKKQKA